MSTTAKVIIGVIVFFFLAAGATCAGAFWWIDNNQERLREQGKAVEKEAHAFAQTADESGCVEAALTKADQCDGGPVGGAMCRAMAGVFLDKCLPAARKTEGFCDGVPEVQGMDNLMEVVNWSVAQCEARGRAGDQECGRLMNRVPAHCMAL